MGKADSLVTLKDGGEGVKISWQSILATHRAAACFSLWCQPAATAGEGGKRRYDEALALTAGCACVASLLALSQLIAW